MRLRLHATYIIGLLLLIAVSGIACWNIAQLIQTIRVQNHSLTVQTKLGDLGEAVEAAESNQKTYLLNTDPSRIETIEKSLPFVSAELSELTRLVSTDLEQAQDLELLKYLINEKLSELRSGVEARQSGNGLLLRAYIQSPRGTQLLHDIEETIHQMDDREFQRLHQREVLVDRYTRYSISTIIVGTASAILLVILFVQLTKREMTRRSKTEEELRRAQEAALVSSKMKSQFLATVSHEIRTPLNGIIGVSDLLRTRLKEAEPLRFAEIIHQSGLSLLKIVNDILDFSKIEAGKIEFELNEFSITSVIEPAAELLAVKAREKKLTLVTYVEPNIPDNLRGDSSRIIQVLNNLVGNAIKFTRSGYVFVHANLESKEDDLHRIRFSIYDSGRGVPKDQSGLLFQAFNQLNVSEEDGTAAGTGLGLSISKNLVERMGGEIGYHANPSGGSIFWFSLPLRSASTAHPIAHPLLNEISQLYFIGSDVGFKRVLESYSRELNLPFIVIPSSQNIEILNDLSRVIKPSVVFADESAPSLQEIENNQNLRFIKLSHENTEGALQSPFTALLRAPFTRGQIFEVLPSQTRKDASALASPAQKPMPIKKSPARSLGRLLLAEDNLTNQILAKALIEQLGYSVHVVSSGSEAIDAMTKVKYDGILMDCRMPVMDGYEATENIRKFEARTGKRIPIIAMTANALDGDREKCLAVGMDDYLSKPFTEEQLAEILKRWIKNSSPPIETTQAIDWSIVKELESKTSPTLVKRLITSFLDTLPKTLKTIEEATKNEDAKTLSFHSHQLKSSSASLGALQFSAACSDLEDAIEHKLEYAPFATKVLSLGQTALAAFQSQNNY